MVKQKVVMKLSMGDAKTRSKALKTAVGLPGVTSVTLEDDRIVVVGEGVDSVTLTCVLRKKMGYVELVSVGSADEKKKEEKKKGDEVWQPSIYSYQMQPYPYAYEVRQANYDNCSIM